MSSGVGSRRIITVLVSRTTAKPSKQVSHLRKHCWVSAVLVVCVELCQCSKYKVTVGRFEDRGINYLYFAAA